MSSSIFARVLTGGWQPGRLGASFIMLLLCVLWSMSGVVARQTESAQGFEMAFWRSAFCCLTLVIWTAVYTRQSPLRQVLAMGWRGVFSGLLWSVMFTCFMLAVMLTTVANTLLAISLSPLVAAILARLVLGIRIPRVTWTCIVLACVGIWWMFRDGLSGDGLSGVLIALGIPVASAVNLILLRKSNEKISLAPAVMLGGFFSAILMLPFAFPGTATVTDVAWLAFLGVFQLALPCTILVWVTRFLPPQEIALLALLEVIMGSLWAWLWGNEPIPMATLQGAILIIGALAFNTLRRQQSV
jgi:drug/metabolite transporter (DMT)-like permease